MLASYPPRPAPRPKSARSTARFARAHELDAGSWFGNRLAILRQPVQIRVVLFALRPRRVSWVPRTFSMLARGYLRRARGTAACRGPCGDPKAPGGAWRRSRRGCGKRRDRRSRARRSGEFYPLHRGGQAPSGGCGANGMPTFRASGRTAGRHEKPRPCGRLMRNAPTFGRAMQDLVDNQHRYIRGAAAYLIVRDGVVWVGYAVYQRGTEGADQLRDGAAAIGFNMMRELCGALPDEVLLSRRPPDDARPIGRSPCQMSPTRSSGCFARASYSATPRWRRWRIA